jgi:hypothetical protein
VSAVADRPSAAGAPAAPPPRSPFDRATHALLVVFVASIPAEYSLVLPALGSISRIVGGVLFACVLLDVLARCRVRPVPTPLALAAAFVLWSALSIV